MALIFDREKCYNGGMTIKKPMKAPADAGAPVMEPLELDAVAEPKTSGGTAAVIALVAAAFAFLMLLGMDFMLWQHWSFLMSN